MLDTRCKCSRKGEQMYTLNIEIGRIEAEQFAADLRLLPSSDMFIGRGRADLRAELLNSGARRV